MKSREKGILTVIIAVFVVAAMALFFSHQLKATDEEGEFADFATQVSEEIALGEDGLPVGEVSEPGAVNEEELVIVSEETILEEGAEITEETVKSEEEIAEDVPEESAVPERSVVVTSSLAGLEKVTSGTQVTLHADLYGFEGAQYTLQWQRSLDGVVWENVEGATEPDYTFSINRENCKYIWRIAVDVK